MSYIYLLSLHVFSVPCQIDCTSTNIHEISGVSKLNVDFRLDSWGSLELVWLKEFDNLSVRSTISSVSANSDQTGL